MKHPRLGLRKTIVNRRELRKEATKAEQVLWKKLRAKQFIGFKFRRQCAIGPYIVDFCARQQSIVIEVDGDIHYLPDQQESDKIRQREIESLGYRVIRYTNDDILKNLEVVLDDLWNRLGQTSP